MAGRRRPLGQPNDPDQPGGQKLVPTRAPSPKPAPGGGSGGNPFVSQQGFANTTGLSDADLDEWVDTYFQDLSTYMWIPEIRTLAARAARFGYTREQVWQAFQQTRTFSTIFPDGVDSGAAAGLGGGGGRGGGGGGGRSGAQIADDIDGIKAVLSDKARVLGLDLDDNQLTYIATYGMNHTYNENQYEDSLLALADATLGNVRQEGTLNVSVDDLRALSKSYMVPLSDQTLQEYSLRIAKGELDPTGVEAILRQQAKARFGYMADLIDGGTRPDDFFKPVRDVVAQTLEMAPGQIDLLDPKWLKLVEVADPKTGQTRGATLSEALIAARQTPDYAKTFGARDQAARWQSGLLKAFGRS